MGKFSKNVDPKAVAEKQAANVMQLLQGDIIKSVGTARNYESALTKVAVYANQNFNCGLRDITPDQAIQYLEDRATEVGQKTLDMERQAMQSMLQNVSNKLEVGQTLSVIKSESKQILESRAYSQEQVSIISNAQNERNGLATEIAHSAGLRAHELHTLQRIEERKPDVRPSHEMKFSGRDGVRYTVHGKGGLVREIQLPQHLAKRLEESRLDTPKQITDRGVHYQTHYDIAAGKSWSNSFSAASNRALSWSTGAHGLRHSYAQERMSELQNHLPREQALEVVSQELGHFRPEITEVYLR